MMEMLNLIILLLFCTPSYGKGLMELGPCARKFMQYRSAHNTAIPSCTQDGSYKPTQCITISIYILNDSSECWCVTVDGNEVPGTRKKMSKGNLDCEDNLDGRMVEPLPPNGGSNLNQAGSNSNQGRPVAPQGRPSVNQGGSSATQGRPNLNQGESVVTQSRPSTNQGGYVDSRGIPSRNQGVSGTNQVKDVSPIICKPDHEVCPDFKKESHHFCKQDWVRKNCENMCGLGCGIEDQSKSSQVVEVSPIICKHDHEVCPDFKKEAQHFCKQDWVKKNCKNLCGLGCGSEEQSLSVQGNQGTPVSNQGGNGGNQGRPVSNQGGYGGNQGTPVRNQGGNGGNQGTPMSNQGGYGGKQGTPVSNQGGYGGNQGRPVSNQGGYAGNQGRPVINQGGYGGNQSPPVSNQGRYGGNQGGPGSNQRGNGGNQGTPVSDQGGYGGNQGPPMSNQGGYSGIQGPPMSNQGGYGASDATYVP